MPFAYTPNAAAVNVSEEFRHYIAESTANSPMEAIALIDSTYDQSEKYFHRDRKQDFSLDFSASSMEKFLKGIRMGIVLGKQNGLDTLFAAQLRGNFKALESMQLYVHNMTTSR